MLPFFFLVAALSEAHTGFPVVLDYSLPDGYSCEELPSDSTYEVISSDSGSFTVVPLVLADTLSFPVLTAWDGRGDTLQLTTDSIVVTGYFPDSLMEPSMPPFPAYMEIPPGLPEDYARSMSFWLIWGAPPGFPWWLLLLALSVLGIAAFFIVRKRRKSVDAEPLVYPVPDKNQAEREALALLESENFIHGLWADLYEDVELQLRSTIAGRFGVYNKALTLNQIAAMLSSSGEGRKFMQEASPLFQETIFQRYADWGSTRERAAGFIRKLARLRKEWSR